jgi:hypothetical protein
MHILKSLVLIMLLAAAGCHSNRTADTAAVPDVRIHEASPVYFPGAQRPAPDKPGECDCNSPTHWDGETLYIFNSAGHPWRAAGSDVFHLDQDYRSCKYNNQVNGGRWIECTWKDDDGVLYGWYHFEPGGICADFHPNSPHLTAPRIGAARSSDNGATWEDLGVVLDSKPVLRCDTTNYYFAGGNGDFSIMLDRKKEFLYFLISTYAGDITEQGVAVARMRWADRRQPAGKVTKWHQNQWSEPGLGGHVTPIFRAEIDWHRGDADAFWGPSIHWNSHLQQFVILLNRAIDSRWKQEGIYVTFNADLAQPNKWSTPRKILPPPGADRWYPQVIGLDKAKRETDKLAGQKPRLFVRGFSKWEIEFLRPGE